MYFPTTRTSTKTERSSTDRPFVSLVFLLHFRQYHYANSRPSGKIASFRRFITPSSLQARKTQACDLSRPKTLSPETIGNSLEETSVEKRTGSSIFLEDFGRHLDSFGRCNDMLHQKSSRDRSNPTRHRSQPTCTKFHDTAIHITH